MAHAYIYTPAVWPPLVAAVVLVALSLYSWRRRRMPGALPLAVSSLFGALWLLGMAAEAAAAAPAARIASFKFQAAWQLPAVTASTCFALEYVYPRRWLTRRNLALLSIPPLLTISLIVINDSQYLWRRVELGPDGMVSERFATLGTIVLAYGLGLILVNLAALLWLFVRSPQHRWPAAQMMFGETTSRGLYLWARTDSFLPARLDPDIIAILLIWTTYAIALFGFRIFDPRPAARAAAIEQMREGIVVFDADWRVVSLNPAAAGLLSTSAARACGRTLAEILPAFPDLGAHLASVPAADGPIEIGLGTGANHRLYALGLSVLKDFRGPVLGYLLQFSDMTEQRRAQAQLLGQQWAEATRQEREQLAHELHDRLAQDLGFLNLQAQAAQIYLQREQGEDARASLARLAEVSRDMQTNVRALIGNLLAVSLPSEGFCATLRQVAARFEGQTGLAVCLDVDADAAALCDPLMLPAPVGVQLIRIVQEALANVRKHAGGPSQVNVRLQIEAGQMQLTIDDNGVGVAPALPGDVNNHFGLQVMRQRAERVGGQLAIHSTPGQGTRVEVRVPLNPSADRG